MARRYAAVKRLSSLSKSTMIWFRCGPLRRRTECRRSSDASIMSINTFRQRRRSVARSVVACSSASPSASKRASAAISCQERSTKRDDERALVTVGSSVLVVALSDCTFSVPEIEKADYTWAPRPSRSSKYCGHAAMTLESNYRRQYHFDASAGTEPE